MEELKTYAEWSKIFEKESGCQIYDDDGARRLESEGRLDEKITRQEAFNYFVICSIMGAHLLKTL